MSFGRINQVLPSGGRLVPLIPVVALGEGWGEGDTGADAEGLVPPAPQALTLTLSQRERGPSGCLSQRDRGQHSEDSPWLS